MDMRESLIDIYNILITDEVLLRLLYYNATEVYNISNTADSKHPLNPSKTNVLSLTNKWDIIYDLIKTTSTNEGLDGTSKNRICLYAGNRKPEKNSYRISKQAVILDVYVPLAFDMVDFRLSWICDRINELLFDNGLDTSIGNVAFLDGSKIESSLLGYGKYRLIFGFGNFN